MSRQLPSEHREIRERARRGRAPRSPARPGTRQDAAAPEQTPVSAPVPAQQNSRRRLPGWIIFPVLLLLVELILLGYGYSGLQRLREETQTPLSCEVRYLVPNQPDLVESAVFGSTVTLHAPVELEGYRFLGWETGDGTFETRTSFPVYEDTVFIARYALPFETRNHIPYLFADGDGVVDVDRDVTIGEYVEVLYRLLDLDRVGSAVFADVEPDDSCYKAAATLKDLGILDGAFLYPDENLTLQELFQILERFYPPSVSGGSAAPAEGEEESDRVFRTALSFGWISAEPADPSASVTRGELARILNRVLGRDALETPDVRDVGMILDVPPGHPYYRDVAEAVIPHSYAMEGETEVWTESEPLLVHEPGLFFAGVRLHQIAEDGYPVLSTTVDGRSFNANGELTSGDAELDRMLWEILEDTVDPETMEPEEMLTTLYNYIVDHFSHRFVTLYGPDAEGWAVPEAKRLLQNREGDSYGYAALFYELSAMIGYQPTLYSGVIYGNQTEFEAEDGTRIEAHSGYVPHAWVEITFEHVSYIFDPYEESKLDPYRPFFKRDQPVRWEHGYRTDKFLNQEVVE